MRNMIYSIIILIFLSSFILPQNIPDFIIDYNGGIGNIAIDNNKNIYVAYSKNVKTYYAAYDSNGNFVINPTKISEEATSPDIASRSSNQVVVWNDITSIQVSNSNIDGKILSDSNTIHFDDGFGDAYRGSPNICFLNDTTFVAVWVGTGQQADNGVFGQIVTTSRNKIGDNIFINGLGNSHSPKVISSPLSDDFVVLWADDHSGNNKVYGRLYNGDGSAKDTSFLVSEDPNIDDLFYLSGTFDNNNFSVVWGEEIDSTWKVKWRWFNENGIPAGPSEVISSNSINGFPDVDISIDKNGNGIIEWEKKINNHSRIYGRRFLSNKSFLGSEFPISQYADTTNQLFPSVILNDEKIYSVWSGNRDSNSVIVGNILDFNNPPTDIKNNYVNTGPSSFYLFQNYPNPFNPSTKIKYTIPNVETHRDASVQLKVYDILGNEIATLVNREQAPGNYEIMFDASNLPSGIFFYTLRTGSFHQTKKMILLR